MSVDQIDHGHCLSLPVEGFDGDPIRPHIEELEEVWQALLAKPVDQLSVSHRLLTIYSGRLHGTYQLRINWLELAILDTNKRLAELVHNANWESRFVRLEIQLTRYLLQLDQAQTGQRRVYERLALYLDGE